MSTPAPTPAKPEDKKEPEQPKAAPKPVVDSLNEQIYPGDTVTLEAVVTEALEDKDASVVVGAGTEFEAKLSVRPALLKKTFSPRIGEQPLLRTPVITVPHPLGGMVPIRANSPEAAEYAKSGKIPAVEGLPNANPAVQKLEAETSKTPTHSEAPTPGSKLLS